MFTASVKYIEDLQIVASFLGSDAVSQQNRSIGTLILNLYGKLL